MTPKTQTLQKIPTKSKKIQQKRLKTDFLKVFGMQQPVFSLLDDLLDLNLHNSAFKSEIWHPKPQEIAKIPTEMHQNDFPAILKIAVVKN